MQSRQMKIGLAEWEGNIADLTIEGEFDVRVDLVQRAAEETYRVYDIKGLPKWGFKTQALKPEAVRELGGFAGYFHKHEEDHVYITPPISLGMLNDGQDYTLIPCLECEVAIKMVPRPENERYLR